MMEVETASSITFVTISSMMEARDWEVAIKREENLVKMDKQLCNFGFPVKI